MVMVDGEEGHRVILDSLDYFKLVKAELRSREVLAARPGRPASSGVATREKGAAGGLLAQGDSLVRLMLKEQFALVYAPSVLPLGFFRYT